MSTCSLIDPNPFPTVPISPHSQVKPGIVHGATDEHGMKAAEKPVHVHDFHATIPHLMGFDHEKLTYRHAGRDYRLTDVEGHVVKEVMA